MSAPPSFFLFPNPRRKKKYRRYKDTKTEAHTEQETRQQVVKWRVRAPSKTAQRVPRRKNHVGRRRRPSTCPASSSEEEMARQSESSASFHGSRKEDDSEARFMRLDSWGRNANVTEWPRTNQRSPWSFSFKKSWLETAFRLRFIALSDPKQFHTHLKQNERLTWEFRIHVLWVR